MTTEQFCAAMDRYLAFKGYQKVLIEILLKNRSEMQKCEYTISGMRRFDLCSMKRKVLLGELRKTRKLFIKY